MNATASARPSGRIIPVALIGIGLLCLSVPTVFGESRGESHRPDEKAPRSRTEIRHEVKTRSNGVQIRISVRQETEGREGSSERTEARERQPVRTQPSSASNAPLAPPAAPPAPPTEPPAPPAEPPVAELATAQATSGEVAPPDAPPADEVTTDAPAASAAPLFSPSVAEALPMGVTTEREPQVDTLPLVTVPAESTPADAPVADVPVDPAPVAETPPVLFPTDPPFVELPPVTLPSSTSRTAITPRIFVADVLEDVPLPSARVRMNPDLGLVAVPTWFWVEGYDGREFGVSRRINIPAEIGDDVPFDEVPRGDPRRRATAMIISVTVRPSSYEWSFGDNTRLVTRSLGRPYPQASDVKHTYEFSSFRSPSGFTVRLTIEFAAEYRINGGAVQALPPIRRSYESSYRVQEIQPVLTNR